MTIKSLDFKIKSEPMKSKSTKKLKKFNNNGTGKSPAPMLTSTPKKHSLPWIFSTAALALFDRIMKNVYKPKNF